MRIVRLGGWAYEDSVTLCQFGMWGVMGHRRSRGGFWWSFAYWNSFWIVGINAVVLACE